ncbi:hypothetical protein NL676_023181 [Syzygium grande]|nr:hypothetical protein NL676_023181 [Syzygium grande]
MNSTSFLDFVTTDYPLFSNVPFYSDLYYNGLASNGKTAVRAHGPKRYELAIGGTGRSCEAVNENPGGVLADTGYKSFVRASYEAPSMLIFKVPCSGGIRCYEEEKSGWRCYIFHGGSTSCSCITYTELIPLSSSYLE